MEVRKILFPTDFSTSAEAALPHSLHLAQRWDAELFLLHGRTLFGDDPNSPDFQCFDEGRYELQVEQRLSDLCEGLDTSQRVHRAMERAASPAEAILQFSEANEIDLITMGASGGSALSYFFLGSVAEKVVRYAGCPVLTVADRKEYRSQPEYQNLLVPYDFSDNAAQAVQLALQLAARYQASVQVLYVIEQDILPPGLSEIWKRSLPDVDEMTLTVRHSLAEALGVKAAATPEILVEVGSGDGRAHSEIQRFAAGNQTDLIVMGSHGLSGIDRWLLGSTTERLLRIAPCPVLACRPGK